MVLRSTGREDICLSFEWCARELMCVCACEYLCKRIAIAARVGGDASFLEQPRIDGERTLHFARIERAQRSVGRAMHGGTSAVTTLPAATIAPSPTVTGATSAVLEPMNAPAPIFVRYLKNPS